MMDDKCNDHGNSTDTTKESNIILFQITLE